MSRRKGSKNARPTFMTTDRLKTKAEKLATAIDDFVEKSLRNHNFNKLVDYDDLNKVKEELRELSKMKIE